MHWLLLARMLWIAIFALTLVVFLVSLSVGGYDTFTIVLIVAIAAIWLVVSGVIFWRKSDDRLVLLMSLGFLACGGIYSHPYPAAAFQSCSSSKAQILCVYSHPYAEAAFQGNYSLWVFPVDFLTFLANATFLLAYLFPDGHFVPRWTRWLAIAWTGLSLLVTVPTFLLGFFSPWNWHPPISVVVQIGFYTTFVIAQVYRYRHLSTALERQQIKWAAWAIVVVFLEEIVALLALYVLPRYFPALNLSDPHQQRITFIAFYLPPVLVPVCIGIAILRYRLWDIDRVINRTLVYGTLTTILVLVYAGSILALQAFLRGIINQTSDVAIVASTLAIAALFQPLRQRVQRLVDRRFYRSKYDAAKIVAAFSSTLRQEVDLDQLREQLLAVVQETMQPAHVSLWLRKPEKEGKRSIGNTNALVSHSEE